MNHLSEEEKSTEAKQDQEQTSKDITEEDQIVEEADVNDSPDSDQDSDNKDANDDLQKQLDELNDKYIRAQAEIVNMQRRNEKEQASLIKYDGQKLAKAILPVMDNLERALSIEVHDENGEQLKKGIEMVQSHLASALKENSVTEIEAENAKFDPNEHQAVQTVAADDDHPADTVVQVLQKGYKLKDRVLRPTMVVVAQ
ncbi:grpE protein [Pediococcus argentinicus]|uniref:Protein GrpE n=1 Tax=Pediococcus argentinicus TaxID=480391 RepID=A0A0R2NKB6_9LACO|nr:grpE protein [Pediococcus argentinicus]